jgi:hypothetical protein
MLSEKQRADAAMTKLKEAQRLMQVVQERIDGIDAGMGQVATGLATEQAGLTAAELTADRLWYSLKAMAAVAGKDPVSNATGRAPKGAWLA